MTAKEYLQQYLNADRAINAKLEQISRLRELATKTTTVLGDDKVQTSTENKTEKIVAKIIDLENEVNAEIDGLSEVKQRVEEAIKFVPESKQRTVLERRYINDDPWAKICTSFYGGKTDFFEHFDSYLRNIYRWHGKALHIVQMSLNVTIHP